VYRQDEMDRVRVLLEIDEGRHGAAVRDQTVAAVAEALRLSFGLRIETYAVAAGTLPRFELKAKRLVRI
ncbi:MAG: phenylacetate--CoA ligase family protein, partial [Armatimonadota bacterium]|nr:phenylacetate--CoA ligase family protein [Armatimonadota bacterium]